MNTCYHNLCKKKIFNYCLLKCKSCLIKKIIYFFIFLFIVACTNSRDNNYSERFPFQRGVNISHWLSQSPDVGQDRSKIFTEKDIQLIARLNYDHIRLPVDEEILWDEKGNKLSESFMLLHQAFSWCMKNKLCVVLDLHQIRSHTFNDTNNVLWISVAEQKRFVQLWMQLSDEFSKYPVDFLAYELLNEAVADNPDDWNDLVSLTIDSLRKKEPHRKIIVGSNRWQSPDTFHDLRLPENDSNIIVSFHFYTPFIFTHYRTHWTETGRYTGPVRYPGQSIKPEYLINYEDNLAEQLKIYTGTYNKDTLLKCIREPIEFAKKHKLQLYCGEFGCTPTVYRSDRLQWYKDVREIFEENDIAWTNWDYKGAFSIFNLQTGKPDEILIRILTDPLSK